MFKSIYVSAFALLVSSNVLLAQITLTAAQHTPTTGTSLNYNVDNTATIGPGASGANVTWDFSAQTGATAASWQYVPLASSTMPSAFPQSNLVQSASGVENYYSTSSSGVTLEGHASSAQLTTYVDKREFLKFPMAYTNTFNETFTGTAVNLMTNQTFNRTGTVELTADGHGTLITPAGTFSNVLRVKQVVAYSDEFMGITLASYVDTIYTWFEANNPIHLANHTVNYTLGTKLIGQFGYLDQTSVGLFDYTADAAVFNVYPNPATTQAFIDAENSIERIDLFSVSGQLVRSIPPSNSGRQTLDLSGLEKGIYILHCQTSSGLQTERLVVQ